MKYIKIKTGYREDQFYTINAEEAHKAYFLFLNPDARGVFSNGVALIGKNIQGIEPDYHSTMGFNPTYVLQGDDWNEIRGKGIDRELRRILEIAKNIAQNHSNLISSSLSEAIKQLPEGEKKYLNNANKLLVEKMKIN